MAKDIGVASREQTKDVRLLSLVQTAADLEVLMSSTLLASSLAATDRCDRCGAQAYVRVVLTGGQDLLFCSHHWNSHAEKLRPVASEIVDETHRLNESSAPA